MFDRKATFTTTTCPVCFQSRGILHGLRMYQAVPMGVTNDGRCATHVGLCENTGHFLWRTTDNFWEIDASPMKVDADRVDVVSSSKD